MPMEWLHVLSMDGIDPVSTLQKLKYELTVADVYDLLEIDSKNRMYAEQQRIMENNNANR